MSRTRPRCRFTREVWMKVIDPQRIVSARRRRKFSQYDLAALCRCTQATISALETGAMRGCSEDLAKQLAKFLDRDVEDLFDRHTSSRARRVTTAPESAPRSPRRSPARTRQETPA